MKNAAILILFLFLCLPAFPQKKEVADTTKKKEQNNIIKKDQDAQVVHITPGSSGVKRGIGYKFLLRRGDEDPGNGLFRFNDDNASDVRFIYVDNLDITGEDQTKFYSSWDHNTGATGRGRVTIADANGNVITVFYFKDVFIDGKGFWKLPVEYVSGVLPIDGHVYYYVFDRIARKEEPDNANLPAPVVPANQVTPVIPVTSDTVVIPVTPVTEVIPVKPVVTVNEVTEIIAVTPVTPVTPVIPVIPVIAVVKDSVVVPVVPVTEDIPVKPVSPSRPGRKVDFEKPDTLINPVVQVNTANRTRPLRPVSRDTVPVMAQNVVPTEPLKPVNPVSQPKPVITEKPINQDPPVIPEKPENQTNPVTQEKPVSQTKPERPTAPVTQSRPANPVGQPKPAIPEKPISQDNSTNPVSKPKPSNQVNQTYPATQPKPSYPVNQSYPATQPKPSIPVNQPYPANQGNQNSPVPESSRLPSYQRYTGTSGGIHGKWYRGIIEIGYGAGVGDYGTDNFRFNFINGFKIGSSSLGLGVGYRRYFTENNIDPYLVSKKSAVPVFLDFRTNFSDRKVTPYFAVGIGGTASADTTLSGKDRLFFTTSGGIWFNLSDRFAVFAGIAYELQKLEFSDTNPYTGNYRKNSNSISLNIGIAF